jgi:hypothetical protein
MKCFYHILKSEVTVCAVCNRSYGDSTKHLQELNMFKSCDLILTVLKTLDFKITILTTGLC